jgi:hypothetical protein
VEFARSSTLRDGGPTLVPVDKGGAPVSAGVFRIKPGITLEKAVDLLWRRETDRIGTEAHYNPKAPGDVEIRSQKDFAGLSEILYAAPKSNLEPEPKVLAQLAIASTNGKAGETHRDGISYLINAKKNGIKTPLIDDYEKKILEQTQQPDLQTAFKRLREQASVTPVQPVAANNRVAEPAKIS